MNFSWFIRFSGIVHKVSILFAIVIPYGCSTSCFFTRPNRCDSTGPSRIPSGVLFFIIVCWTPLPDVSGCIEVTVMNWSTALTYPFPVWKSQLFTDFTTSAVWPFWSGAFHYSAMCNRNWNKEGTGRVGLQDPAFTVTELRNTGLYCYPYRCASGLLINA